MAANEKITIDIVANLKGLGSGLKKGIKSLKSFAKKAAGSLKSFAKGTAKIGAGIAAAFVGAGVAVTAMVLKITESGDLIAKTSKRLGASAEEVSALKFAAERSGAAFPQLVNGMKTLTRFADEAAQGMAEYKDEFDRAGITVTDANGQLKSTSSLMLEVADAISKMDNKAEQLALAQSLFGRGGVALLPLLKEGKKGIQALTSEAVQLGAVWSTSQAKLSERTQDAWLNVKSAIGGTIRGFFLSNIVPAFADGMERMTSFVVDNRDAIMNQLKPALEFIKTGLVNAFETMKKLAKDGTLDKWLAGVKKSFLVIVAVAKVAFLAAKAFFTGLVNLAKWSRNAADRAFKKNDAQQKKAENNFAKALAKRKKLIAKSVKDGNTIKAKGLIKEAAAEAKAAISKKQVLVKQFAQQEAIDAEAKTFAGTLDRTARLAKLGKAGDVAKRTIQDINDLNRLGQIGQDDAVKSLKDSVDASEGIFKDFGKVVKETIDATIAVGDTANKVVRPGTAIRDLANRTNTALPKGAIGPTLPTTGGDQKFDFSAYIASAVSAGRAVSKSLAPDIAVIQAAFTKESSALKTHLDSLVSQRKGYLDKLKALDAERETAVSDFEQKIFDLGLSRAKNETDKQQALFHRVTVLRKRAKDQEAAGDDQRAKAALAQAQSIALGLAEAEGKQGKQGLKIARRIQTERLALLDRERADAKKNADDAALKITELQGNLNTIIQTAATKAINIKNNFPSMVADAEKLLGLVTTLATKTGGVDALNKITQVASTLKTGPTAATGPKGVGQSAEPTVAAKAVDAVGEFFKQSGFDPKKDAKPPVTVEVKNTFTGTFEKSIIRKNLLPVIQEALKTGALRVPGVAT